MKDLTAILPLLGVAVGWLLNQATARRTERLADQRVVKEMLYSLLELYGILTKLSRMHAMIPAYVTRLRKLFPVAPPAGHEAALDELLTKMMRDALAPFIGQKLAGLKDDYSASLLKLAAVDPVSAHRLRGQEEVLQRLPQVVEVWQHIVIAHLGEPAKPYPDMVALLRQHLEPAEIADTRDVVGEVIQQLCQQLDRRTRREVAAALAKSGPNEQEITQKMEKLMKEVLPALLVQ